MASNQSVGLIVTAGVVLVAGLLGAYLVYFRVPPLPDYDLDAWWGPTASKINHDKSIRPFVVKFGKEEVIDLKARLRRSHRFTPPLEGVGFQYGFNTDSLKTWLQYWVEKYPFEERERWLNQFPQYKTNVQGLDLHYIRVTPKVPQNVDVVRLLLLHGWPSSFLDFYPVIPAITSGDPDRNFTVEVIVPSLPGFGFSDAAVRPGLGALEAAVLMRNLMHRIGLQRYYVHGGDVGAIVAKNMATLFPDEVLGLHLTMPGLLTPMSIALWVLGSIYPPLIASADVQGRMYPLSKLLSFYLEESGYLHIQATKPDTLGIALAESPAGLLAYILEKFSTGLDHANRKLQDGGLNLLEIRDQLLDNVMVYWISNSMTTAMRIYSETFNSKISSQVLDSIPTYVPTCVLQAKQEIAYQPRAILELKYRTLLYETSLPYGGHFLSWEMPEVFSADIIKALSSIRTWRSHHINKTEL